MSTDNILIGEDRDRVRLLTFNRPDRANAFNEELYHAAADALRAAAAAGDGAQVGAIAHRLKSSSRSIGALALGELCAELESAGPAGPPAALAPGVARFDAGFAAVTAAIDSQLAESEHA